MEYTIHPYQRSILRKLMYNRQQRFSEMQIPDLSSKHFNYHLNQLLKFQLVEKSDKLYSLTTEGKKYIQTVDEANMKVEKQPKVSVVVFPVRQNRTGENEILLSKRLKHPNYGKVVGIGGKVRFGETFEEAAHRELMEETNLTGDFEMAGILRKIAFNREEKGTKKVRIDGPKRKNVEGSDEVVLDILFVLFRVKNARGKLIRQTSDQKNLWCKLEGIAAREDISSTVPQFVELGLRGHLKNFELVTEAEGF